MPAIKGFTIVEILVVVVVIGIIASIVVVSYSGVTQSVRRESIKTEVQSIAAQLKSLKNNDGSFPLSLNSLKTNSQYTYQYQSPSNSFFCLAVANGGMVYYATSQASDVQEGSCTPNIVGGRSFSVYVNTAGNVYTWGQNDQGQLANGATSSTTTNTPVSVGNFGVTLQVSAGYYHVVNLTADNKIISWGRGVNGQLGNGSASDQSLPVEVIDTGVLANKTIVAVSAGGHHSLALSSDGKVYSWGSNGYGQLGNGANTSLTSPVEVNTSGVLAGKKIIAIEAGYSHSVALDENGQLYAWGTNDLGQLGNGSTTASNVPVLVDMSGVLNGKTVRSVSAGLDHTLVLASDNRVYGWGRNSSYQLGNGSTTNALTPVAALTSGPLGGVSVRLAGVTAGMYSSAAMSVDNTTWYVWGQGAYGQLANNSTSTITAPAAVSLNSLMGGKTFKTITLNENNAHAQASDGSLYVWGRNDFGQVGNNSTTTAMLPVPITMP